MRVRWVGAARAVAGSLRVKGDEFDCSDAEASIHIADGYALPVKTTVLKQDEED